MYVKPLMARLDMASLACSCQQAPSEAPASTPGTCAPVVDTEGVTISIGGVATVVLGFDGSYEVTSHSPRLVIPPGMGEGESAVPPNPLLPHVVPAPIGQC